MTERNPKPERKQKGGVPEAWKVRAEIHPFFFVRVSFHSGDGCQIERAALVPKLGISQFGLAGLRVMRVIAGDHSTRK